MSEEEDVKLRLLIENFDCEQEILTECEGVPLNEKTFKVSGTCIQTEILNSNRRVYPKSVVKPEITRYIREKVDQNKAIGELDHPLDDQVQGNLKNASHKFTRLEERGDTWFAEATILKTPMGMTARGLMEAGVVMGMSSRAVGKTKAQRDGTKVVQSHFRLFSAGDLVTDPSAPDAYMTNLMENKEWVWQDGVLVEKEQEIKDGVNKLVRSKRLDDKMLIRLFEALTNLKVRRKINER